MRKFLRSLVLGTVGILLTLPMAVAAERQGAFVQCDDGRRLNASPFGDPARMCGEVDTVEEVDDLETQYAEIFGDLPTRENSGLTGRSLRTARFLWRWNKDKFGGIVTPVDAVDAAGATHPEAVTAAIEAGVLSPDVFNLDSVDRTNELFFQYGLGTPRFYIAALAQNSDNFTLYVALDGLVTHRYSGVNAIKYPQLVIAQAQDDLMKAGVCVQNPIRVLSNPTTRNPCN